MQMPQNISKDALDVMQVSVDWESDLWGTWRVYVMHLKSQLNVPQYVGSHTFRASLHQDLAHRGLSYDWDTCLLSGTSDAVTQWILTYA